MTFIRYSVAWNRTVLLKFTALMRVPGRHTHSSENICGRKCRRHNACQCRRFQRKTSNLAPIWSLTRKVMLQLILILEMNSFSTGSHFWLLCWELKMCSKNSKSSRPEDTVTPSFMSSLISFRKSYIYVSQIWPQKRLHKIFAQQHIWGKKMSSLLSLNLAMFALDKRSDAEEPYLTSTEGIMSTVVRLRSSWFWKQVWDQMEANTLSEKITLKKG